MILKEERQFHDLCQLIFRKLGLDCKQYKENYLKRRLAVRMRATNKKTYKEYQELLQTNPEEYDWLLDRLTINVSNFFRDPSVFYQVEKVILPAWQKFHSLHVWSAGCANGEEPYTIAIMLQEKMPLYCSWDILATDIDPTVLERARNGSYKNENVKTVPAYLKTRYFLQDGDKWIVKPHLRKKIIFEIQDLTGEMPKRTFDLIICRNVLIYFVSELQERLFRNFYKCLRPAGYLILGKTETLLGEVRHLYDIIDIRERIYQRKESEKE